MTESRRPKGPPVRLRQDLPVEAPMPSRPAVESTPPPPVFKPIARRPRALRLSVLLWQLSFVAGLAGAAFLLAGRDDAMASLSARIIERRPDTTSSAAESLANRIVILSAVVGVVLVLAGAALMLGVWQHRRMARNVLGLVGVVTIVLALVQYEVLPDDGLTLTDPRVAVLTQAGLVVLGLLTLMAGSARRWIRDSARRR